MDNIEAAERIEAVAHSADPALEEDELANLASVAEWLREVAADE